MSLTRDNKIIFVLQECLIDIESKTPYKKHVKIRSHVSHTLQMNKLNGNKEEKVPKLVLANLK